MCTLRKSVKEIHAPQRRPLSPEPPTPHREEGRHPSIHGLCNLCAWRCGMSIPMSRFFDCPVFGLFVNLFLQIAMVFLFCDLSWMASFFESWLKCPYRHPWNSLNPSVSPRASFWRSRLCLHGFLFDLCQTCKSGTCQKRAHGHTAGNSKSEPVETHTD
jgi:hypothetical protein